MLFDETCLRDRVLELFRVDLNSGVFTRRSSRGGRNAGDIAGSLRPDGYRSISVDNKSYLEHKLVMLVSLGFIAEQVDHINGDKGDNRLENLRPVTRCLNARNQKMSAANKSGATGVRYRASRDAYEAYWDEGGGKKKHKYFSCNKYGSRDEALYAASSHRKTMIDKMNGAGAGYTDRHGERIAA